MLLFRAKIPEAWLEAVTSDIPAVLVDHAHLERRAASSALNLEKYHALHDKVEELNAIAIEELQHFQLVLNILRKRDIPFGQARHSPWISGLMRGVRTGERFQVIDHLICAALIEGRSCEKFQMLATALETSEPELAAFYAGLMESEGNHYATYLLMARAIDHAEADARLDGYLDREAALMHEWKPRAMLH